MSDDNVVKGIVKELFDAAGGNDVIVCEQKITEACVSLSDQGFSNAAIVNALAVCIAKSADGTHRYFGEALGVFVNVIIGKIVKSRSQ